MLIHFLNILTFAWLALLSGSSIRNIARSKNHSIDFVIPVHFIFCAIPLFLNEVIGQPTYEHFPGFALATSDEHTNIIYCLYISAAPIIWLLVNSKNHKSYSYLYPIRTYNFPIRSYIFKLGISRVQRIHVFISYILMISPLVLVFFSQDPEQYLKFSSVARYSEAYKKSHGVITIACNLSVLSACYIFFISKPLIYGRWPNVKSCLITALWIIFDIWIHGKRNIVAVVAVLLIFAFYYRGLLKGIKFYVLTGIGVIIVLSFSFFFQSYTERIITTPYENFRIDYGRDDVIKTTIFAELNPDKMQILEYRGQSLVFLLTAFIPRSLWPEKPLPYAQYLTSAIFFAPPRFWGWGMTTSWLEEAIANFGWLGLFIGPWLISFFCRTGDSSNNNLVSLLTPLLACLLLVVEAIAYAPLIIIWLFLVIHDRRIQKHLAKRYNKMKNRKQCSAL